MSVEPVSVVINTYNAARTLDLALRSVTSWADEIFVIDQNSLDGTQEIAKSHGATVVLDERPPNIYPTRSLTTQQGSSPWIFVLDADELVPRPLAEWLCSPRPRDEAEAWRIPRLNYFWGSAVKAAGWSPDQDAQLRFFKRGCVQGSDVVHQDFRAAETARVRRLPFDGSNAIVHFNYFTVSDFLLRLDRYTSLEAARRRDIKGARTNGRALWRSIRIFRERFLRDGGRRCGWRGFYLSAFMSFYSLAIDAKIHELEEAEREGTAQERYRAAAEHLLSQYSQENPHTQQAGP